MEATWTFEVESVRAVVENGIPRLEIWDDDGWDVAISGPEVMPALKAMLDLVERHAAPAKAK